VRGGWGGGGPCLVSSHHVDASTASYDQTPRQPVSYKMRGVGLLISSRLLLVKTS